MKRGANFSLNAYLKRVNVLPDLIRSQPPSRELLLYLMHSHVANISFDTADSYMGRGVSLELNDVVDKLVHAGRGGYCFEHNTLFLAVLQSLRFDIWRCVSGRVVFSSIDAFCGRTHMVNIIQLPATQEDVEFGVVTQEEFELQSKKVRWTVDVGFGANGLPLAPLRLDTMKPQSSIAGTLRVRPHTTETDWVHYYVEVRLPKTSSFKNVVSTFVNDPVGVPETERSNPVAHGYEEEGEYYWKPLYHFDLQPQYVRDFYMMNFLIQNESVFTRNLVFESVKGHFEQAGHPFPSFVMSGYDAITNQSVTCTNTRDGKEETKKCASSEEVYDSIQEYINITLCSNAAGGKYAVSKEDFVRCTEPKLFPKGNL
ncbi:N-acetyltransferase, putative [Angomonas deanei]|uniref:N-acetyltransferase, putative n=1 Tax=Angomonas deanei TaxID=59799 RepID=A0A7G2CGL3_9TRYP|nr:N-acetyltransferase, putative [Angomonas deanei]